MQTGKSTLIRKCIKPYVAVLGGFSSQRILMEDGRIYGYRLAPAANFQLNMEYCPGVSGVFLRRQRNRSVKEPLIFATRGIEILQSAEKSDLILLDEIGGVELLAPDFRKKLYELLAGDIPCIGVLKLKGKARFMGEANDCLRQDLHRFGAKIIAYDSDLQESIEGQINDFLKRRLMNVSL